MDRPSPLELILVGAFLDLTVAYLYYKHHMRVCPRHGLERVK
jgi:hypothetical protein